ncbi:efflux RND transporter periplasmic adaptor subunit [Xanthobacter sp. V4C-4]|uniref:efflux RND transporter periplasmic adaptor subunit n=1 Tax=Xanthobacter cornucopiae TaxID=3119924 RepID=UPI0037271D4D
MVAATLLLSACNDDNSYVAPPPVKVTVAQPMVATVPLYVEFTGNTAASATVDLDARVQGYLTAINYVDGEAVKKGRVLFEIEKTQYQAQVEQQQARLESAQATAANALRGNDRQAALGERQVASQSKVEDAQTALATANADVSSAEAALKLAEASLAYTTVTAPFDGVVTRHLVDVGALVGSSGPTKLARILQVSPLLVYFNITEQQQIELRDSLAKAGKTLKSLRGDKLEMPVEVLLSSGAAEAYEGRVDYVAPQVDAQTGTLEMRAVLENTDISLVPGLFVRVRLRVGGIENALLVNDTAVLSNQAGSYVKVIGKDNVVEQRPVTTGPVEGQLRVITGGLSADDRVVVGAIQRAVVGNTVTPVAGAMAGLPAGLAPKENAEVAAPSASR